MKTKEAKVIIRNDEHNTFDWVALCLAEVVPRVDMNKGFLLADTVHREGEAIVWQGNREAAELYHHRLRVKGLSVAPLE